LGDSITAGVGGTGYAATGSTIYSTYRAVDPAGVCWANMLVAYLQDKFDCTAKNWGISGRASIDIITNIATLVESSDDIVILMIGTNDRNASFNTSLVQFATNLDNIVSYVQQAGKQIVLMSSIPTSVANETDGAAVKSYHMEDIDNVIMSVAASYNMEYISLYKQIINYCDIHGIAIDSLLADGLHPNDTGYGVMFNLVLDSLGIGRKRSGATW
jgi:lysophospholipase L1-like esterase